MSTMASMWSNISFSPIKTKGPVDYLQDLLYFANVGIVKTKLWVLSPLLGFVSCVQDCGWILFQEVLLLFQVLTLTVFNLLYWAYDGAWYVVIFTWNFWKVFTPGFFKSQILPRLPEAIQGAAGFCNDNVSFVYDFIYDGISSIWSFIYESFFSIINYVLHFLWISVWSDSALGTRVNASATAAADYAYSHYDEYFNPRSYPLWQTFFHPETFSSESPLAGGVFGDHPDKDTWRERTTDVIVTFFDILSYVLGNVFFALPLYILDHIIKVVDICLNEAGAFLARHGSGGHGGHASVLDIMSVSSIGAEQGSYSGSATHSRGVTPVNADAEFTAASTIYTSFRDYRIVGFAHDGYSGVEGASNYESTFGQDLDGRSEASRETSHAYHGLNPEGHLAADSVSGNQLFPISTLSSYIGRHLQGRYTFLRSNSELQAFGLLLLIDVILLPRLVQTMATNVRKLAVQVHMRWPKITGRLRMAPRKFDLKDISLEFNRGHADLQEYMLRDDDTIVSAGQQYRVFSGITKLCILAWWFGWFSHTAMIFDSDFNLRTDNIPLVEFFSPVFLLEGIFQSLADFYFLQIHSKFLFIRTVLWHWKLPECKTAPFFLCEEDLGKRAFSTAEVLGFVTATGYLVFFMWAARVVGEFVTGTGRFSGGWFRGERVYSLWRGERGWLGSLRDPRRALQVSGNRMKDLKLDRKNEKKNADRKNAGTPVKGRAEKSEIPLMSAKNHPNLLRLVRYIVSWFDIELRINPVLKDWTLLFMKYLPYLLINPILEELIFRDFLLTRLIFGSNASNFEATQDQTMRENSASTSWSLAGFLSVGLQDRLVPGRAIVFQAVWFAVYMVGFLRVIEHEILHKHWGSYHQVLLQQEHVTNCLHTNPAEAIAGVGNTREMDELNYEGTYNSEEEEALFGDGEKTIHIPATHHHTFEALRQRIDDALDASVGRKGAPRALDQGASDWVGQVHGEKDAGTAAGAGTTAGTEGSNEGKGKNPNFFKRDQNERASITVPLDTVEPYYAQTQAKEERSKIGGMYYEDDRTRRSTMKQSGGMRFSLNDVEDTPPDEPDAGFFGGDSGGNNEGSQQQGSQQQTFSEEEENIIDFFRASFYRTLNLGIRYANKLWLKANQHQGCKLAIDAVRFAGSFVPDFVYSFFGMVMGLGWLVLGLPFRIVARSIAIIMASFDKTFLFVVGEARWTKSTRFLAGIYRYVINEVTHYYLAFTEGNHFQVHHPESSRWSFGRFAYGNSDKEHQRNRRSNSRKRKSDIDLTDGMKYHPVHTAAAYYRQVRKQLVLDFTYYFIFGSVLGLLAWKTRSVAFTIWLHIAHELVFLDALYKVPAIESLKKCSIDLSLKFKSLMRNLNSLRDHLQKHYVNPILNETYLRATLLDAQGTTWANSHSWDSYLFAKLIQGVFRLVGIKRLKLPHSRFSGRGYMCREMVDKFGCCESDSEDLEMDILESISETRSALQSARSQIGSARSNASNASRRNVLQSSSQNAGKPVPGIPLNTQNVMAVEAQENLVDPKTSSINAGVDRKDPGVTVFGPPLPPPLAIGDTDTTARAQLLAATTFDRETITGGVSPLELPAPRKLKFYHFRGLRTRLYIERAKQDLYQTLDALEMRICQIEGISAAYVDIAPRWSLGSARQSPAAKRTVEYNQALHHRKLGGVDKEVEFFVSEAAGIVPKDVLEAERNMFRSQANNSMQTIGGRNTAQSSDLVTAVVRGEFLRDQRAPQGLVLDSSFFQGNSANTTNVNNSPLASTSRRSSKVSPPKTPEGQRKLSLAFEGSYDNHLLLAKVYKAATSPKASKMAIDSMADDLSSLAASDGYVPGVTPGVPHARNTRKSLLARQQIKKRVQGIAFRDAMGQGSVFGPSMLSPRDSSFSSPRSPPLSARTPRSPRTPSRSKDSANSYEQQNYYEDFSEDENYASANANNRNIDQLRGLDINSNAEVESDGDDSDFGALSTGRSALSTERSGLSNFRGKMPFLSPKSSKSSRSSRSSGRSYKNTTSDEEEHLDFLRDKHHPLQVYVAIPGDSHLRNWSKQDLFCVVKAEALSHISPSNWNHFVDLSALTYKRQPMLPTDKFSFDTPNQLFVVNQGVKAPIATGATGMANPMRNTRLASGVTEPGAELSPILIAKKAEEEAMLARQRADEQQAMRTKIEALDNREQEDRKREEELKKREEEDLKKEEELRIREAQDSVREAAEAEKNRKMKEELFEKSARIKKEKEELVKRESLTAALEKKQTQEIEEQEGKIEKERAELATREKKDAEENARRVKELEAKNAELKKKMEELKDKESVDEKEARMKIELLHHQNEKLEADRAKLEKEKQELEEKKRASLQEAKMNPPMPMPMGKTKADEEKEEKEKLKLEKDMHEFANAQLELEQEKWHLRSKKVEFEKHEKEFEKQDHELKERAAELERQNLEMKEKESLESQQAREKVEELLKQETEMRKQNEELEKKKLADKEEMEKVREEHERIQAEMKEKQEDLEKQKAIAAVEDAEARKKRIQELEQQNKEIEEQKLRLKEREDLENKESQEKMQELRAKTAEVEREKQDFENKKSDFEKKQKEQQDLMEQLKKQIAEHQQDLEQREALVKLSSKGTAEQAEEIAEKERIMAAKDKEREEKAAEKEQKFVEREKELISNMEGMIVKFAEKEAAARHREQEAADKHAKREKELKDEIQTLADSAMKASAELDKHKAANQKYRDEIDDVKEKIAKLAKLTLDGLGMDGKGEIAISEQGDLEIDGVNLTENTANIIGDAVEKTKKMVHDARQKQLEVVLVESSCMMPKSLLELAEELRLGDAAKRKSLDKIVRGAQDKALVTKDAWKQKTMSLAERMMLAARLEKAESLNRSAVKHLEHKVRRLSNLAQMGWDSDAEADIPKVDELISASLSVSESEGEQAAEDSQKAADTDARTAVTTATVTPTAAGGAVTLPGTVRISAITTRSYKSTTQKMNLELSARASRKTRKETLGALMNYDVIASSQTGKKYMNHLQKEKFEEMQGIRDENTWNKHLETHLEGKDARDPPNEDRWPSSREKYQSNAAERLEDELDDEAQESKGAFHGVDNFLRAGTFMDALGREDSEEESNDLLKTPEFKTGPVSDTSPLSTRSGGSTRTGRSHPARRKHGSGTDHGTDKRTKSTRDIIASITGAARGIPESMELSLWADKILLF